MARADGWYPPTRASVTGCDPKAEVRCPRCRRPVPAEMVYVIPGHGEACDACRETLFREGTLSRGAYFRTINAPADLVGRHAGP